MAFPAWAQERQREFEARGCVVDVVEKTSTIYQSWSSVGDFCSVSATDIKNALKHGGNDSWGRKWSLGSHVKDVEEATTMLRSGSVPTVLFDNYIKASQQLEPLIEEFAGISTTTKKRRVLADNGDMVNVDRVLAGDVDCWESRRRGASRAFVRIGVQFANSAGADEQQFIKAATLAAAASDVLQTLGYATEIIGYGETNNFSTNVGSSHFKAWNMVHKVILKEAHYPLDPQAILALGIPAFSRVFEFANLGMWNQNREFRNGGARHQPNTAEFLNLNAEVRHSLTFTADGSKPEDDVLTGFLRQAAEVLS